MMKKRLESQGQQQSWTSGMHKLVPVILHVSSENLLRDVGQSSSATQNFKKLEEACMGAVAMTPDRCQLDISI